ncbi:MAG: PEP-CTERM sorting domain-containing protein [Planctomycetaceae bacterium]|nr:PEP-CTERM sorting domain-containing protein [Planctomycetaceae bacterium]
MHAVDLRKLDRQHEDGIAENSYWTTGDWNSDGDFNSSDLVAAFRAGQYEVETAAAVPEPTAFALMLLGLLPFQMGRRRFPRTKEF